MSKRSKSSGDSLWSPPRATYRLQLSPRFTFADARAIVPYLATLGISHVYASPIFKARAGSEHGYDITDHNAINPELGGDAEFERFSDALRAAGLGLILDFVPNHMGVAKSDNAWWLDILEHGPSSPFSGYFDIDWSPPKPELNGKLLLPILGDHYGAVLARGELELKYNPSGGALSVHYHEHRLPLRPRSYAAVIRRQLSAPASLSAEQRMRFESLAVGFDTVRRLSRKGSAAKRAQLAALKNELSALCREDPRPLAFMNEAVRSFVIRQGNDGAMRTLHALLDRQHYRLAFWRVAADEINYRRFFDINDLAGLRVEDPAVFDSTHVLLGRLISEGRVHGVRIDHVDGLFDPEAYLKRLQAFARARRAAAGADSSDPFYIVVEKILAFDETLPPRWPVAGTTGYEFAAQVNGLFVDSGNRDAIERTYRNFTGQLEGFDSVVQSAKRLVIDTMLAGELNVLANELDRISERSWDTRDYTFQRLRSALREIVCHFPIYRTYVSGRGTSPADRRAIEHAVTQARRDWHGADGEIFMFVQEALNGDLAGRGKPFRRAEVLRFAMHFQQYSGPIMAKALEDTSFYRYVPLLSLNEVGGGPEHFGMSPSAFHAAVAARAVHWPQSMLATTTHDTKRGEDSRVRLASLSEMPSAWSERLDRWSGMNAALRSTLRGQAVPSRNEEYLLYQTLLGAWPTHDGQGARIETFAERIQAFMIKALREAKRSSGWNNPNLDYETAVSAFVAAALDSSRSPDFLSDFEEFVRQLAFFGSLNGLTQLVLKAFLPGVPDIYQGSELWELSLVDPDNRRDVDFGARRDILRQLDASALCLRASQLTEPRTKLAILHATILARRRHPSLFSDGKYQSIAPTGSKAQHAVALSRRRGENGMIVVCPRLVVGLLGASAASYDPACWRDTALPGAAAYGRWRDILTHRAFAFHGEDVSLSDVLRDFPIAILEATPA